MDRHKGELSRRAFLIRTSLVSLGALAAGTLPARTAHAETGTPMPPHGADLRGTSLPLRDPNAEGRFGYMLKGLPPYTLPDDVNPVDPTLPPTPPFDVAKNPLRALGSKMLEPSPPPPVSDTSATAADDENDRWNENPNEMMTSGVTFFSQFVDHDITLDLTPLEEQLADPDAMTDFRTPRYDLDSIYGLGPNDTTPGFYHRNLYDPNDRAKFLLINRGTEANKVWDVPRYGPFKEIVNNIIVRELDLEFPADADHPAGTAVIADRRNDQTLLVLQVHVALLMFHNAMVDYFRRQRVPSSGVFEMARRYTRWHYQWVVIQDLLKRLVNGGSNGELIGPKGSVYREVARKAPVITLNFYKPQNRNDRAFMPLEFSVAAFRFGHSLARPRYTVNETLGFGNVKGIALFADDKVAFDAKLNGGRPIPPKLKVQWSRFFNPSDVAPSAWKSKRTRQIDSDLSMPLFSLPESARPDKNGQALLAVRNLLRGQQLKLPSGQEVALRMGVPPLTNAELAKRYTIKLDKTTFDVMTPPTPGEEPDTVLGPIITHDAFNNKAPLWFYILKEAELIGETKRLGPVGGRLVAEVLVGLLQRDPTSYLYLQPGWKPTLPTNSKGEFGIVELLKYAGVWS